MKTLIADIYTRVSTKEQDNGNGHPRQLGLCLKWCEEHGVTVRNIIKENRSAWAKRHNLNSGKLHGKIEQWRKGYWQNKGEPLTENECPKKVVSELPPDFLVMEDYDRFSRKKPLEVMFTMMILGSIGIKFAFINQKHTLDAKSFHGTCISKDHIEVDGVKLRHNL
jgi:DNA invertase Pin-like site-specific DNA recombinase